MGGICGIQSPGGSRREIRLGRGSGEVWGEFCGALGWLGGYGPYTDRLGGYLPSSGVA